MQESYYASSVGTALKAKLSQLAAQSPERKHSLNDEIDVNRIIASEYIQVWDQTFSNPEASELDRVAAGHAVRNALRDVGITIERASRVRTLHEATANIEILAFVVDQMIRIIEDRLHDQPDGRELARQIQEDINKVTLPLDQTPKDAATAIMREMEAMRQTIAPIPSTNGNGHVHIPQIVSAEDSEPPGSITRG